MKSLCPPRLLRTVAIVAFALSALACQTTRTDSAKSAPAEAKNDEMGEAMIQPFTDLNITRAEIPAPLEAAASEPYRRVQDDSCSAIGAEIARLDAALGPDVDSADEDKSDDASAFAAGALRSLTTGWIPFRGVLRRLTGAQAHADAARKAVLAGALRRAYLKGVGERQGCPPPAAPKRGAETSLGNGPDTGA